MRLSSSLIIIYVSLFTVRLHGIANTFLSVRLSVCLSNACIVTKGKKLVPTFLYHMKDHSSWFSDKKNGRCGRPLLPEILGQTDPWSENAEFQSIFARSASAVTPSEKRSIITNRKSTVHYELSNEPMINIVHCP